MATIQINDQYRLRSDSRQWIFEKITNSKNDKGEVIYTPLKFYTSLGTAVKAAHGYFLRVSDAEDVTDLIYESNRILYELKKVFTPYAGTK